MVDSGTILIVEDEQDMLLGLQRILSKQGYCVDIADSGAAALEKVRQSDFDIVITDLKMPGMDGIDLLRKVKAEHADTLVIVMTGYGTVENAVEAMKLGACDFIAKPFDADHIRMVVRRVLKQVSLTHENRFLKQQLKGSRDVQNIIGDSGRMQDVFKVADKVARTDTTVLLLGESGTGKELIARYIHNNSRRKNGVFIPVNCGALTETLLESELFGHEKGAFTGAVSTKRGLIEIASGGTFFFDEIGDVCPAVQGKLLRVLQEREFMRVGGTTTMTADIRIIAATNKNLEQCLKDGSFREDLYYRLNVIAIRLPALRERKEDIPSLAQWFVRRFSKKMQKNISGMPRDVLEVLMSYDWPGNVRELENAMERAVVLATGGQTIQLCHLPDKILQAQLNDGTPASGLSYREAKQQTVDSFNRDFIKRLLKMNDGNISQSARQAKMDGANFRRLMRRCDIQAEEHK
ncbi:MAG: sigma-54 dependent transcriptional regulator [Phycisphaerae bacterium]|nr:sigma-54 dependent transcriptional regulator [Phycisphaerae bacterium]